MLMIKICDYYLVTKISVKLGARWKRNKKLVPFCINPIGGKF